MPNTNEWLLKVAKKPYNYESQVNQLYAKEVWFWLGAALYLEHPKSKKLQPITKGIQYDMDHDWTLVWLADFSVGPILVREDTPMYVSEEFSVTGNTIKQMRDRVIRG